MGDYPPTNCPPVNIIEYDLMLVSGTCDMAMVKGPACKSSGAQQVGAAVPS